jgi:hypothetical protein
MAQSGDPEDMVVTCGHSIDSGSGATAEQAPNDLLLAMGIIVAATCTNDIALNFVTVYVGQDAGSPLIFESDGAPEVGGQGTSSAPPNTATLIRKRTGIAGRRGRGRMYFPGVGESLVGNTGNLTSTFATQVQGAASDWLEDLTTGAGFRHYPPVVFHRSEGIGTEPVPTPVTAMQVEGKVATQRRRLRP